MVNRKQRRAEEKMHARDLVTCEKFFKDDQGNRLRVVVDLTFKGEMGISLFKNGDTVEELL